MNKKIIIFIDDLRNPSNYVDVKNNIVKQSFNYNEFVLDIQDMFDIYGKIDEIWFDHDLGDNPYNGYDCAKFLVTFCESKNIPVPEYHIHSANPVGRKNIDSYLKSYIKIKNS